MHKHLEQDAEDQATNALMILRDFIEEIERNPGRPVRWALTVDPIRSEPRLRTLTVTVARPADTETEPNRPGLRISDVTLTMDDGRVFEFGDGRLQVTSIADRRERPCPLVFKGADCRYAGTQAWCDKTYVRCAELLNAENFRG